MNSKVCTKCGDELPASEFYRDARRRDGMASWCKRCKLLATNAYKAENAEKKRAQARSWHAANRESENARTRGWHAANRERVNRRNRAYHASHPEAVKAKAAVNDALAAGKIERPGQCSKCGVSCRPEGHHDNYARQLDVRWLCASCHRRHHGAERRRCQQCLDAEVRDG